MNHLTDDQLNEYLDTANLDHPAIQHLETCADCRSRLDDLRALFTTLESLPEIQPPHNLAPAILGKLPNRLSGSPIRFSPVLKTIFLAQATISIALLIWLERSFNVSLPTYELPTLDIAIASIVALLPSLSLQFPTFQMPAIQLPTLTFQIPSFEIPSFQLPMLDLQPSTSQLVFFIISILLLWLVGNGLLLRTAPRNNRK